MAKIQQLSWWASYPNGLLTRIVVGKVTSFMLGFPVRADERCGRFSFPLKNHMFMMQVSKAYVACHTCTVLPGLKAIREPSGDQASA